MSQTTHKVTKENGEEIKLTFKKIKGRKQLKVMTLLGQIVGGDLIKEVINSKMKGSDLDLENIDIGGIISNLSDENIDRLTDKFCSFVVSPNLKEAKEDTREEFFEQFELGGLFQMLAGFVLLALTGSYPENKETLKK